MDTVYYREVNCFFYAVIWIAWWTGVQMGGMCSCMDFRGCFLEVKGSGVWNGSWQLLLLVEETKLEKLKKIGYVPFCFRSHEN